jgi:hypothetical protein
MIVPSIRTKTGLSSAFYFDGIKFRLLSMKEANNPERIQAYDSYHSQQSLLLSTMLPACILDDGPSLKIRDPSYEQLNYDFPIAWRVIDAAMPSYRTMHVRKYPEQTPTGIVESICLALPYHSFL